MRKYDYEKSMYDDVVEWINEHILLADYEDPEELEEYLNDALWCEDSVTGNASGSYTFCAYTAEEYLCHNLDLLDEAAKEFCCTDSILERGAERADVTIRCYLLPSVINRVVSDLEKSGKITA